jgi:tetratricopeptide (TPR) repeat protein
VVARPPTFVYQCRKLVARHRTMSALAASLLVFVCVAAVGSYAYARKIARQRDEIAAAAERAQRASTFLQSIIMYANPRLRGKDYTMRQALEDAAARVDDELDDMPDVEADVRTALGHAFVAMSRNEAAEEQYRLAWGALGGEYGERDPRSVEALRQYAAHLRWMGSAGKAEPLLRRGLDQITGDDDEAAGSRALLTDELGNNLTAQRRFDEAEETLGHALDMTRSEWGPEDPFVAIVMHHLANMHFEAGNRAQAIALEREVLAFRRSHPSDNPSLLTDSLYDLAAMLNNEHDAKQSREAEALLRERLAIVRSNWGERTNEVAVTLGVLAAAVANQGRLEESEHIWREALAMKRDVMGNDDYEVANTASGLAIFFVRQGRFEEAIPLLNEAWQINKSVFGPADSRALRTAEQLGDALAQQGGPRAAIEHYENVLRELESMDSVRESALNTVQRLIDELRAPLSDRSP